MFNKIFGLFMFLMVATPLDEMILIGITKPILNRSLVATSLVATETEANTVSNRVYTGLTGIVVLGASLVFIKNRSKDSSDSSKKEDE